MGTLELQIGDRSRIASRIYGGGADLAWMGSTVRIRLVVAHHLPANAGPNNGYLRRVYPDVEGRGARGAPAARRSGASYTVTSRRSRAQGAARALFLVSRRRRPACRSATSGSQFAPDFRGSACALPEGRRSVRPRAVESTTHRRRAVGAPVRASPRWIYAASRRWHTRTKLLDRCARL